LGRNPSEGGGSGVLSDRSDGDRAEHFLVDGVAPAVIGGGPPESPFDPRPEPEPEPAAHRGPASLPPPRAATRQEPPTSPIPVIRPAQVGPEKRKSWLAKVFRPSGG
jgi:hypothetical protein